MYDQEFESLLESGLDSFCRGEGFDSTSELMELVRDEAEQNPRVHALIRLVGAGCLRQQ